MLNYLPQQKTWQGVYFTMILYKKDPLHNLHLKYKKETLNKQYEVKIIMNLLKCA